MRTHVIIFINLIFSLCLSTNLKSQFSINDLLKMDFNKTFSDSDYVFSLINRFDNGKKDFLIMKSDFMKSYYIDVENFPFDYYGKGNYNINFWKDSLAFFSIDYYFPQYRIEELSPFLKQLFDDLNNNNFLNWDNQFPKIELGKLLDLAKSKCIEGNSMQFSSERLGTSIYWTNNLMGTKIPSSVILEIDVTSGYRWFYKNQWSIEKDREYDGRYVTIRLCFFNENSIERFNQFVLKKSDLHYVSLLKQVDGRLILFDRGSTGRLIKKNQEIPLKIDGGVYKLPVILNDIVKLDFIFDAGASDVSITPDLLLVLLRSGQINDSDFIGSQTYKFADGSTAKSGVFILRKMKIGDREIFNIRVSVSNTLNSPLLLGQSALNKFKSYKLDVDNSVLILE